MARLNTGQAASGALSGAATGATIGSIIPGIGTGIGAGIGGLFGGLSSLFGSRPKRRSTFDKTQKNLYKQYAAGLQGQGQFADLFNFDANSARENFNQMYAQPAYQQFQENVIPGITGQFRGGNLQNSSYLGGALSKAGTDVQNNLNANLSNMLYQGQQSALERRLQSLQNMLGMQTFAQEQRQPNGVESILSGLSQGTGQYLGNQFANRFLTPTQGYNPGSYAPISASNAINIGRF